MGVPLKQYFLPLLDAGSYILNEYGNLLQIIYISETSRYGILTVKTGQVWKTTYPASPLERITEHIMQVLLNDAKLEKWTVPTIDEVAVILKKENNVN
jgi:hypothetical protein